MLNIAKLELVKEQYNNLMHSKLIIFKGEYGLGKSTLIDTFINDLSPLEKIIVKPCSDNDLAIQPIVNSLLEYFINKETSTNSTHYNFFQEIIANNFDNKYMFSAENLKYLLFNICKEHKKAVILFSDFDKFNYEVQQFAIEFIKTIVKLNSNFSTFILVECNTDELSASTNENLSKLYDFCEENNIVNFNKLTVEELTPFIDKVLGSKLICSNEKKLQIIEASFHNPLYLKNILYYLRENNILKRKDSFWQCDDLDSYLLSNLFKEYILRRYQNLDKEFKDILQKASIIGFQIDETLLKSPFRINKADEALLRIEKLSNLIKNKINKFEFENYEVYYSIKNLIPLDEKKTSNKILAEYLKKYLKRNYKMFKNNNNWQEYLKCLYKIAFHYEESERYNEAFQAYISCIPFFNSFSDYVNSRTVIEKAISLYSYTDFSQEYLYYLKSNLAELYKSIGEFQKAIDIYDEILNNFIINNYEKSTSLYNMAYCFYNIGKANKALDILGGMKEKLKDSNEYKTLFIKVLFLLASIYDHHGNKRDSTKYYGRCLKECKYSKSLEKEYYTMLGRANMFYTYDISINILEQSAEYFRMTGDKKEYAKVLHNLGSENINAYNLIDAERYLNESMEIFNSYCSNDIHYPINNLAIIKALTGRLDDALKLFFKAYSEDYEFFSQIWIKLNIATCFRKLKKFNDCIEILDECKKRLDKSSENTSLLECYLQANYGFYYKERNDLKKALEHFYLSYDILSNDLNDIFYINFFLKIINELSVALDTEIDKKLLSKNIVLSSFQNYLYENNVLFGDFMFWGS